MRSVLQKICQFAEMEKLILANTSVGDEDVRLLAPAARPGREELAARKARCRLIAFFLLAGREATTANSLGENRRVDFSLR